MKLEKWREIHELSYEKLAKTLLINDVENPAMQVWKYCQREAIPRKDRMIQIVKITGGQVMPNDFYLNDK
tara:strand:+ start:143 stop:352 length:210 start_codon:yes stop_codon:yes gene_type:complete